MVLSDLDWDDLLYSISQEMCVPFIGAWASAPWIPIARDIAQDLSKYEYTFEDSDQLSKVAQFVAIFDDNEVTPKNIVSRQLERIQVPDFSLEENRDTPYAVLADLNAPVYIITNYDHFMEEALRSKGKNPVSEFCVWNKALEESLEIQNFSRWVSRYNPSKSHPFVYHLHGDFNTPLSMVLTENDYIEYLVRLGRDPKSMLPPLIRMALARSILLFVGYSLEDITLRVLLKTIRQSVDSKSIAVMRPPKGIPNIQKYEKYLDSYSRHMFGVRVDWGDVSNFLVEIGKRLRARGDLG
jgi:hypothetical protein